MEVGGRRSSCSIRRPGHPPPPPPPPKPVLGKELEGRSALQSSEPLTNLGPQPAPPKQNVPLRRAPPPPLPRAPKINEINGSPLQPQNRPINCNLPSPPHVRSTLSVARSISAMPTKTSVPVSVVRPYNFPPLPSKPVFDTEVESSEESKSPGEDFFFQDSAHQKIPSSGGSPSFLDELQQAFPLLRQEGKALPSHPNCSSPGQPKCNEDDQSEPNSQKCLSVAEAVSIADLPKAASPRIDVKSEPSFERPPPPSITLQRGASVPVIMPHTNPQRKPPTVEKPLCFGKGLVHQTAALRPVIKSSSMRDLTIRKNEVGYATLPRPPPHRQHPSLPPRPQSLLLPAAPPPPPPRRRESLRLPEECQNTATSSFETRFLRSFHSEEDLPPPELSSPL